MKKQIYTLLALLMWSIIAMAQSAVDESLGRHDFFYAGQSKQMRMFIVKDGHVAWSYWNKEWRGEISDAILMTDGHVLMAHQYGIAEVTQDNQVVWHYDAPEGTEIHTIQPIGRTHVVFVQNGHPAKAVVMEIPSKRIVREFELPVSEKGSVHGQFRNARLTSRGTLLVANMGLGMVNEYTCDGKEVDRWTGLLPWSAQELPKGNLLITGRKGLIQEITRMGETVWQTNTTEYGVTQPQKTVRLKDGHHLINNWYNEWNKTPMDTANAPVQAVEIDKDGKVVWQLRSWVSPDLGPSTTIQPLSEAVNRDRLFFGEFNPVRPKQFVGPNEPIGVGRGIHPGRVAWIHSPGVAKWDGRTGLWVEDRWNDQSKADGSRGRGATHWSPHPKEGMESPLQALQQDPWAWQPRIPERRDDSRETQPEQRHHPPRYDRVELVAFPYPCTGALLGERGRCTPTRHHPL